MVVPSSESVAALVTFTGGTILGIETRNFDGGDADLSFDVQLFSNLFYAPQGGREAISLETPISIPGMIFRAVRFRTSSDDYWPNDTAFFAFRLDSGYGWIKVIAGFDGTPLVYNVAYDTEATSPIQVGVVPEPSSFALLGLLATGAAGVMAWKRCRRKQQQGDGVEE